VATPLRLKALPGQRPNGLSMPQCALTHGLKNINNDGHRRQRRATRGTAMVRRSPCVSTRRGAHGREGGGGGGGGSPLPGNPTTLRCNITRITPPP